MKRSKKIVFVLAVIFFSLGCQSKDSRIVPGELRGVWKTSAPKYEGCYFELTEDEIIFNNENFINAMHINSIKNIEKIIPRKRILYTIVYEDKNEQEYELSFYYDPSRNVIRYKNQQEIAWKKTKRDEY